MASVGNIKLNLAYTYTSRPREITEQGVRVRVNSAGDMVLLIDWGILYFIAPDDAIYRKDRYSSYAHLAGSAFQLNIGDDYPLYRWAVNHERYMRDEQ